MRRAFSLTELIFAITIAIIIIAAIASFGIFALRMHNRTALRSEINARIRPMIQQLETDIGNATTVVKDTGNNILTLTIPTLKADGTYGNTDKTIEYKYANGKVIQTDSGVARTMLDHVTPIPATPFFKCYNKALEEVDSASNKSIAAVETSFKVEVSQSGGPPIVIEERIPRILVRNLWRNTTP